MLIELDLGRCEGIDDGVLQWEADETRAFLNKQLSRDPRKKPDDIVASTDHMRRTVDIIDRDKLGPRACHSQPAAPIWHSHAQ